MDTRERLKLLAAIADGEQRGLAEALKIYCPDWIPAAGNAGAPNREYTATRDPRWRKVSILVAQILTQRQVETASILRLAELFDMDAGWSGWHPPGDWWNAFPKSPSWCRSQMNKWLTEGTVQRKGERGDIRFLLSFLKELDIEPPI